MPPFFSIPTADLDVNGNPTTLANLQYHANAPLTGVNNNTEYRAWALSSLSPAVTPAPAGDTFGRVVQTGQTTGGSTGGTNISVGFAAPCTIGNLIVIAGGPDKGADVALTYPAGFTVAEQTIGASGDTLQIAYKISDGSEQTFNFSWTTEAQSGFVIAEYEGPFDASPLDVTAKAFESSDVSSLGTGLTALPTQNDNLFVGVAFKESTISGDEASGGPQSETFNATAGGLTLDIVNEDTSTNTASKGNPRVAMFSDVQSTGAAEEFTAEAVGTPTDADAMAVWIGAFKKGS